MRQNLAALLLGALAGAIIFSLVNAGRLEQLYWEKEKLRVDLFETTERLAKVESLLDTHQEDEVISVKIEINSSLNAFTQLELRERLSEVSAGLVGEKIENINPELVLALFQNRKISVDGKDYLTTVNWIIIARETIFNLTASPADE